MLDFNLALTDIASLTGLPFQPMIDALSAQSGSNGIGISFRQGFNKPLSNVVFLRPQKIKAVLIRLLSMMGCIGESKDSLHLVAVCQPDTVHRPMIGIIGGGLNPQTRTPQMKIQSPDLIRLPNQKTIQEFKAAAISLCGGSAFLFLPNPSQAALTQVIAKCERLLVAAKALLEVINVA